MQELRWFSDLLCRSLGFLKIEGAQRWQSQTPLKLQNPFLSIISLFHFMHVKIKEVAKSSTWGPFYLLKPENCFLLSAFKQISLWITHDRSEWHHDLSMWPLSGGTLTMPSRIFPKTTCLPSSQGVLTVVMKNWEPLVSLPALAMLSQPSP